MTDNPSRHAASHQRSRVYLGAVLAVLALAVVVVLVVRSHGAAQPGKAGRTVSSSPSATSSTASEAESLARFTGSGDTTTKAFSAASNWEITWEAKPQSGFTVELLDKDGVSRGEIVTGNKKAKGSTFVSEAGEFTLKVSASAPWSIAVVGRTPEQ
ncbi:hypothetical protein [Oryzobacter telluris]|uniref:hypothetical protein n=1 Tax=Oryzobacter telluris TaxID=3149179 RepID=UPI00370D0137